MTPEQAKQLGPNAKRKPSLARRVLSGGVWALAGRVLFMVGGVAVTTLLTRALEPAQFGSYVLLQALALVASTIGLVGMGRAVVKLVPAYVALGQPNKAYGSIIRVITTSITASLLVALVLASLGSLVIGPAIGLDLSMVGIAVLITWSFLLTGQSLLADCFRSFHDIRLAGLFNGGIRSVILVVLLLGALLVGVDLTLWSAAALTVVAIAASNFAAVVLLVPRVANLSRRASKIPRSEVLPIGWPLMVNQLLLFIIMRANLWIIGGTLEQSDVAVYGAVLQLTMLLTTPLLLMAAVIPPMISEMYAQPEQHATLQRLLRTVATLAGLPALGVLAVFVLAGPTVLGLIFGDFYRSGATAMAILGLSQVVNVWTGMCGPLLSMTAHQRPLMMFNLVFSGVALLSALILIPRFGINGAALATTIAIVLQNSALAIYAYNKTGIISVGEIRPHVLVRDAKMAVANMTNR